MLRASVSSRGCIAIGAVEGIPGVLDQGRPTLGDAAGVVEQNIGQTELANGPLHFVRVGNIEADSDRTPAFHPDLLDGRLSRLCPVVEHCDFCALTGEDRHDLAYAGRRASDHGGLILELHGYFL
jgi:hypothetical protein